MPTPNWAEAPAVATHAWLDEDGSLLHWVKFENEHYFFFRDGIWPVVPLDLLHTRGSLVARP